MKKTGAVLMKKNTLRKIFLLSGILTAALLLLSGCGGKKTDGPSQAPAATKAHAVTETRSEEQPTREDEDVLNSLKNGPGKKPASTKPADPAPGSLPVADTDDGGMTLDTDEPAEMPAPAGISLTGLRFISSGMYMSPVYAIRQTQEGFACSISDRPVYWQAMDGDDFRSEDREVNEEQGYSWDADSGDDPLAEDAPSHSLVLVDEQPMYLLTNQLMDENILEWDGYDETWEPPVGMEVTDTGESFTLEALFSDGTHVKAHGIDAYPDNYNEVVGLIYDFFEEHQDYSAYYPTEFPDAEPTTLIIKFFDPHHFTNVSNYQIELHPSWDNEWIIRLTDPKGEFTAAGTDISKYGYVKNGELPMKQFTDILKKYNLGEWNQAKPEQGAGDEYWEITIYYDNGQSYHVYTNRKPDNYHAFRQETVQAIADYYNQVSGTAVK